LVTDLTTFYSLRLPKLPATREVIDLSNIQPAYQSPVEVASGIYMVPIPIPIPLKYVNCFLMRGPSGWTLMDTGFHDNLAEDAWPRAFDELGIRAQDIDQIVISHYHPDHFGAAGWLQELSGAPVFMHEPEFKQVEIFWGKNVTAQGEALRSLFHGYGMPMETAELVLTHHGEQRKRMLPLPTITQVATGAQIRLGTDQYEVLWTPGHSDGLSVFWNAESGLLMANDMILTKITPNVSLWPNCRPNPLQDYIDSLVKVEALHAKLALTGHRAAITEVTERTREIRLHHAERLTTMEQACDGIKGATGWEVCTKVFRTETLSIHQIRFAMSETLAHLVYMEKQGRLLTRNGRFVQA